MFRKSILTIFLFTWSQMLLSTNYVFISSGFTGASYTNPLNWQGGMVGPTMIGPTDTVTITSIFTTCFIDVHIENNGWILIQSNAKLTITDSLTNFGTIRNQGEFGNNKSFISYGTVENNWSFNNYILGVLENCGSFFNNGCKNSGAIMNKGIFTVEFNFEDDTLTRFSTFENSGQLIVGSFATYHMGIGFSNFASGSLTNDGNIKTYNKFPASLFNDGLISNNLGTIDIHPLFVSSGPNAKITGGGLIHAYSGSLDGTLYPNRPMQFNTQFVCTLTDSLLLEIDISSAGAYDTLHFDYVGLSGILKINYTSGNLPFGCREYVLITFNQLHNAQGFNTFDSLDLPEARPGFKWEVVYNLNDVTLRYYPDDENNNALSFRSQLNQDSSYVQVNSLIGEAKTIEFRFFPFKVNPNEPGEMIMSLDNSAGSYILSMGLTSQVDGETMSLTNEGGMIYTTYPFAKEWYHVAFVAETNHYAKIFVNGMPVPVFFRDPNVKPPPYQLDSFKIGARKPYSQGYTQAFFGGELDEFRFWEHTRTDAQILEYYHKELPYYQDFGLKAYYPMNQGKRMSSNQCIDYLTDVSGFENHGELFDFHLEGFFTNWVGSPTCEALIPANNIFVGEASDSTAWFEDDNWSLGIPSGCHHVVIPNGMEVQVDGDEAICYTIEVEMGGDLEVVSGRALDVKLTAY